MPNGYRMKERPKRKHFWLKVALVSLMLAAIAVLVFVIVYYSQVTCDCQYPVLADPSCMPASTPSPYNYTADEQVKQEMILVNDAVMPDTYRLPGDLIPVSYKYVQNLQSIILSSVKVI